MKITTRVGQITNTRESVNEIVIYISNMIIYINFIVLKIYYIIYYIILYND